MSHTLQEDVKVSDVDDLRNLIRLQTKGELLNFSSPEKRRIG